jgi:hypothetical protein
MINCEGGEDAEGEIDNKKIGSDLLLCLLLATQKRVGSIKYPMEQERMQNMMKTTSRLVLIFCSASC